MKNSSIWQVGVDNKKLDKLNKDIVCDILIIGGGMAGLSVAYFLKDCNKKVVLIDKDKCGCGASGRNTGKLSYMQGLIYHKLVNNYNEYIAKLYLDSQRDAIRLILNIIDLYKIDCNLMEEDSYVFVESENELNKLNEEIKFYKKNNIDTLVVDSLSINYSIIKGIKGNGCYSFNPYKYLVSIKNIIKDKIDIYENTRCIDVSNKGDYYYVKLDNGNYIQSKKVVVACQYPLFIVPFFTPFKTGVEKSYIVAIRDKDRKIQAINDGKKTKSFNYYNEDGGYLLYSSNNHSVNTKLDARIDKDNIVNECKRYFNKSIEYYFENHDVMSYDYMPFIGEVSRNMYILTGFNKWGNTNGIIGGKVISDLIFNRDNNYIDLFSPKRSLSFLKIKNLIMYNCSTSYRYVVNKVNSNKAYYNNRVYIEYIDGKKCGIYIDNKGKHIVSNICPHMKCNLIFNYVDKTWDCPCHASRFDIDGNVIRGPSTYNIKIVKKL